MTVKKTYIAVAAVMGALAVVFFCLWMSEKNSRRELRSLCQENAAACAVSLTGYQKTGDEKLYRSAAAEFYAFAEAYRALTDAGEAYSTVNEISAYLTLSPSLAMENIGVIADAMEILSSDCTHANGLQKLRHAENVLREAS